MKRLLFFLLFGVTVFAQSSKDKKPEDNIFNIDSGIGWITTLAKGPSLELITTTNGEVRELLRVRDGDGKMLITVHMDGSVTTDNNFKPDATAKIFWKALAGAYPCTQNSKP